MAKLKDVNSLTNLTAVFGESNDQDGSELPVYLRGWSAAIESDIKNMKPFDTYLEPERSGVL